VCALFPFVERRNVVVPVAARMTEGLPRRELISPGRGLGKMESRTQRRNARSMTTRHNGWDSHMEMVGCIGNTVGNTHSRSKKGYERAKIVGERSSPGRLYQGRERGTCCCPRVGPQITSLQWNTFKRALAGIIVLLVFSIVQVEAGHAARIALFVDGYGDCCASKMSKVKDAFREMGIAVHDSPWNSLSLVSGNTSDDQASQTPTLSTGKFISQMNRYFSSLPAGTEVYLIGHSFGADSILRFLEQYRSTEVKIMLAAVLDPVTFGGMRTTQYGVGDNVEYFFNRWQTNAPWPLNTKASGRVPCSARTCDQEEQKYSRHSNGRTRETRCGPVEICPGKKLIWEGMRPRLEPGYKQTKLHHQNVPTDQYVQEQICDVVREQTGGVSRSNYNGSQK